MCLEHNDGTWHLKFQRWFDIFLSNILGLNLLTLLNVSHQFFRTFVHFIDLYVGHGHQANRIHITTFVEYEKTDAVSMMSTFHFYDGFFLKLCCSFKCHVQYCTFGSFHSLIFRYEKLPYFQQSIHEISKLEIIMFGWWHLNKNMHEMRSHQKPLHS